MSSPEADGSEFDALERAIVDHLFVLQPTYAVALGLHEYDGRLPDLSVDSTERWIARADELLQRLGRLDRASLIPSRKVDGFLLGLLLESPLFDLRMVSDLERNPMNYLGAASVTAYLSREYAPVEKRVQAIIHTLEQVPRLLATGRERLRAPLPKPFLDLSLAIGGGLPTHFVQAEEFAARAHLADAVRVARVPAEAAVADFLTWLREHHLPQAVPEFALGAARYQRLLFVREGLETSFDELRRSGAEDLERNQRRLAEIALAEHATIPELLEGLFRDHPSAKDLIAEASAYVEETRRFVATRDLATVPEEARCRVEETPSYGRALSTASLNPPGPFDSTAAEGVYYVTPVDGKWTEKQQEEWLRSLNRPMLRNVTVHEVYPGHYLQFLHFRRSPGSLARKVFLSRSFVEGWAHYCEQLAIEQGLARESVFAEVAQLCDALLRDCRLLVSVGLHTGGMTLEEGTQFFQREAYLERLPAEREAIRGTFDPEYFCYTVGKLAILRARARLLDSGFGGKLRAFHDTLLGLGCPPVGLLESLIANARPG